MAQQIEDFLRSVFGAAAPGYIPIWTKTDKRTAWFRAEDLAETARYAAARSDEDDCYFGVGLQEKDLGPSSRGTAGSVIGIGGIWFDLDVKGPAHSQDKLPATIEEALSFLAELPNPPTIIVRSGNGLQVWWLFEKPWIFADDKDRETAQRLVRAWTGEIRRRAEIRGWKLDNTSDLARVLRAPGTLNHKLVGRGEAPTAVTILSATDRRYQPGDFQANLTDPISAPASPQRDRPDVEEIATECAWLRHCRDDAATLPEPEWLAMLSIVGRCDDGQRQAHEWSKSYPRYTPEETEAKLDRALTKAGPWTCAKIREMAGEEYCQSCAHWGRIESPITLGQTILPRLIEQYVYVVGIKRFCDRSTFQLLDKEQLHDAWAHQWRRKGSVARATLTLKSLVKVDSLTFAPGREQIIEEDGERRLNLWRKPDLEPVEGDPTTFIEHMEYLIPDAAVRDQYLDALAYIVQQPGTKIHYALALIGVQGIGKTFLAVVIERLIGKDNVITVDSAELQSQFTGWLKQAQVVVIEEMMALGRRDIMNKLKPLITQNHVRINEKFTPPYRIPNRANFIIFSNHLDAILIESSDRRYFIYESPAQPRQPAYYKELFSWFNDNAGIVLRYLIDRNLDHFNPAAHAPMTNTKREVIEGSRAPVEAYFSEALKAGEWPFVCDLVVTNHLVEAVRRLFPATVGQVTTALRNLGAVHLGQKRMADKTKPSVWAVRKHEIWRQADESLIRSTYRRPIVTAKGKKMTVSLDKNF